MSDALVSFTTTCCSKMSISLGCMDFVSESQRGVNKFIPFMPGLGSAERKRPTRFASDFFTCEEYLALYGWCCIPNK